MTTTDGLDVPTLYVAWLPALVPTVDGGTAPNPRTSVLDLPPAVRDTIDAVTTADARWFRKHPRRRWRLRSITDAERQAQDLSTASQN